MTAILVWLAGVGVVVVLVSLAWLLSGLWCWIADRWSDVPPPGRRTGTPTRHAAARHGRRGVVGESDRGRDGDHLYGRAVKW
jgi:hypothetical protein